MNRFYLSELLLVSLLCRLPAPSASIIIARMGASNDSVFLMHARLALLAYSFEGHEVAHNRSSELLGEVDYDSRSVPVNTTHYVMSPFDRRQRPEPQTFSLISRMMTTIISKFNVLGTWVFHW